MVEPIRLEPIKEETDILDTARVEPIMDEKKVDNA